MIHLTLNTGSLSEFDPAACHRGHVRTIRRLFPKSGGLPAPWSDLRIDFGQMPGSASFCIWRADVPMLMNVVCWNPAHSVAAFAAIEAQYLKLSEISPQIMNLFGSATHLGPPDTTHWLATLMLPSILQALPPAQLQTQLTTIARLEQATAIALIPTTSP